MSAIKTLTAFGAAGIAEASYGAGGVIDPATDAIRLAEEALVALSYELDGEHERASGTGGRPQRTAPQGLNGDASLRIEARGANQAYSSVTPIVPNDLDLALRIAGHSKTHDDTVGLESVTYAPQTGVDPSVFESGTFDFWARGEKATLTGVLADMNFTVSRGGFWIFEFPIQGIGSLPVDETLPGTIALDSHQPPTANDISLSVGAWSPEKVEETSFTGNIEIVPSLDMNNAGNLHDGFTLTGNLNPELQVTVGADALATYDPYVKRDTAAVEVLTFTVGPTQFNRLTFTANQTQVVGIEPAGDGVGMWTITYALKPSDDVSADRYEFFFD